MAGIAVVFYTTNVNGHVGWLTPWVVDAQAEASMNNFAAAMTTKYRELTPEDPGGEYGEARAHPDGGAFALMLQNGPDVFPGNGTYPAPPSGSVVEWVGESWDPPP